jgi:dihydrofolate reductase
MKRRVRYQVAASLDGFIAGPGGEYDWIVMDPSIDFDALFKEFETAIVGRKTYEHLTKQGGNGALPGLDVIVFSRTLPAVVRPGVRIVNDDAVDVVAALKAKPGGDIWLFGGGELFRSLLDARLVDTVEVAVMPVLLGRGIPLLPSGTSTKLVLTDQKTLPGSGIVVLSYLVAGSRAPSASIQYVKTGKARTTGRLSNDRKSAKSTRTRKTAATKKRAAKNARSSRSGARAASDGRPSRRR